MSDDERKSNYQKREVIVLSKELAVLQSKVVPIEKKCDEYDTWKDATSDRLVRLENVAPVVYECREKILHEKQERRMEQQDKAISNIYLKTDRNTTWRKWVAGVGAFAATIAIAIASWAISTSTQTQVTMGQYETKINNITKTQNDNTQLIIKAIHQKQNQPVVIIEDNLEREENIDELLSELSGRERDRIRRALQKARQKRDRRERIVR